MSSKLFGSHTLRRVANKRWKKHVFVASCARAPSYQQAEMLDVCWIAPAFAGQKREANFQNVRIASSARFSFFSASQTLYDTFCLYICLL